MLHSFEPRLSGPQKRLGSVCTEAHVGRIAQISRDCRIFYVVKTARERVGRSLHIRLGALCAVYDRVRR